MENSVADGTVLDQGTEAEPIVTLTEAAAERAKISMQREGLTDHALRVGVVGGGCSGFQYTLGFDKTQATDDVVLEQNGVRMFIDPGSLQYLRGMVIDYVSGLHGAGFKFVNPNASRTCGCGSSFSA